MCDNCLVFFLRKKKKPSFSIKSFSARMTWVFSRIIIGIFRNSATKNFFRITFFRMLLLAEMTKETTAGSSRMTFLWGFFSTMCSLNKMPTSHLIWRNMAAKHPWLAIIFSDLSREQAYSCDLNFVSY